MIQTLFNSILDHPQKTYFDGKDNDETILYVFRRSFITNFDWIFVSILLIIAPFILTVIWALVSPEVKALIRPEFVTSLMLFWSLFTFGYIFQNFLNWFFNIYIITDKRILDLDFVGFLYKNISEAPLSSIEDVTSNVKGTLRIIFNYGHVLIQTAAEQREFDFADVSHPARVRDIISDIVANRKQNQ